MAVKLSIHELGSGRRSIKKTNPWLMIAGGHRVYLLPRINISSLQNCVILTYLWIFVKSVCLYMRERMGFSLIKKKKSSRIFENQTGISWNVVWSRHLQWVILILQPPTTIDISFIANGECHFPSVTLWPEWKQQEIIVCVPLIDGSLLKVHFKRSTI